MKISSERILNILYKNGDFTGKELREMTEEEFIVANWDLDGVAILKYIATLPEREEESFDDFLKDCIPCGGNWNGMILSGIKKRFPIIYDLIPNDMGTFAFTVVCDILYLLNIKTKENSSKENN